MIRHRFGERLKHPIRLACGHAAFVFEYRQTEAGEARSYPAWRSPDRRLRNVAGYRLCDASIC